jgi:putative membrane protein
MRVIATLLFLTFAAVPAAAHGPVAVQPDALWRSWNFDPLVLAPLLLSHWLYGRGVLRLWARAGSGRGMTYLNVLAFALGETALIIALVSPVDPLGETLLSAHMAQHALLVAVAPPLLLLGKPGVAFAWALPASRRRGFLLSTGWRWLAGFGEALSRPLPAAVLHGLTLWFWHAPAAFDAAVASYGVHALEHASFGTAVLFWRAVLNARSSQRAGRALGAAFATLIHGGLLGALITMAPYPLYSSYLDHTELWGLSPLEDQQVAGLLMWVPMGVIYLGACLLLAGRLVGLEAEPVGSSQVKTIPEGGQS